MGISLSVRPVDQQERQLALRFYSKQYCAMTGVLVRRFRLALNKHIVGESVKKKSVSVLSNDNGLFEETNEHHIIS